MMSTCLFCAVRCQRLIRPRQVNDCCSFAEQGPESERVIPTRICYLIRKRERHWQRGGGKMDDSRWMWTGVLVVLGFFYYAIATAVRYVPSTSSHATSKRIYFGKLAIQSKRTKALPWLNNVLPGEERLVRPLALALLCVGILPIVGPLWCIWTVPTPDEDWAEVLFAIFSTYPAVVVISGCLLLWLCNRALASAVGLFGLPDACNGAGWTFRDWVRVSKDASSYESLLARSLLVRKDKRLIPTALAAYAFYIAGFLAIPVMASLDLSSEGNFGLAVFFVPAGLWVVARQLRQVLAQKALKDAHPSEPEHPILYLRAFKDDSALADASFRITTLEEHLVRALMASGRRVVALGKPGERLPQLGAERFYVDDAEWQAVISMWIDKSKLILMCAAPTEATSWEIQRIFISGNQEKLMLLFPFARSPIRRSDSAASSTENITVERLHALGVPKIDLGQLGKEELIGFAFDKNKDVIALTAGERNTSEFEEAIKWQIQQTNSLAADTIESEARRKAEIALVSLILVPLLTFTLMFGVLAIVGPRIAISGMSDTLSPTALGFVSIPNSWVETARTESSASFEGKIGPVPLIAAHFSEVDLNSSSSEVSAQAVVSALFRDARMIQTHEYDEKIGDRTWHASTFDLVIDRGRRLPAKKAAVCYLNQSADHVSYLVLLCSDICRADMGNLGRRILATWKLHTP
jgi:hypothetical protein